MQLYSYMSKRGLRAGVLTTYYHTRLLLADTKGDLQISSMIPYSQKVTESTLSIVEVSLPANLTLLRGVSLKFNYEARVIFKLKLCVWNFFVPFYNYSPYLNEYSLPTGKRMQKLSYALLQSLATSFIPLLYYCKGN